MRIRYVGGNDELDINGGRLLASPVSGVSKVLFLSLSWWRKSAAPGSQSCSVTSALVVLHVFFSFGKEYPGLLSGLPG